jgi:hypothetical protein
METQTENNEKSKTTKKVGGLLFAGCMFMGMAAGWYSGHLNIGLFSGMGMGFILMAVVIASQAGKRQ